MPLCSLAFCLATKSVQGTTATYGNSCLNVLLLLAVAVVLCGLGARFLRNGRRG